MLKTDYKNDVLDTSVNDNRKYEMTNNSDGTISLTDVTVYSQEGSLLGANDINATNTAVNELNDSLTILTEWENLVITPKNGVTLRNTSCVKFNKKLKLVYVYLVIENCPIIAGEIFSFNKSVSEQEYLMEVVNGSTGSSIARCSMEGNILKVSGNNANPLSNTFIHKMFSYN